MAWKLTEPEQAALMDAIQAVLEPHMEMRKIKTLPFVNEDGTVTPPGESKREYPYLKADAPEEIKRLEGVYSAIIDRGAVIGSPRVAEGQMTVDDFPEAFE